MSIILVNTYNEIINKYHVYDANDVKSIPFNEKKLKLINHIRRNDKELLTDCCKLFIDFKISSIEETKIDYFVHKVSHKIIENVKEMLCLNELRYILLKNEKEKNCFRIIFPYIYMYINDIRTIIYNIISNVTDLKKYIFTNIYIQNNLVDIYSVIDVMCTNINYIIMNDSKDIYKTLNFVYVSFVPKNCEILDITNNKKIKCLTDYETIKLLNSDDCLKRETYNCVENKNSLSNWYIQEMNEKKLQEIC